MWAFDIAVCKKNVWTYTQVLRQAEARRFEELGSRLRNQRQEAEERKKEREVKLTDRPPPSKRSRTGCKKRYTAPRMYLFNASSQGVPPSNQRVFSRRHGQKPPKSRNLCIPPAWSFPCPKSKIFAFVLLARAQNCFHHRRLLAIHVSL